LEEAGAAGDGVSDDTAAFLSVAAVSARTNPGHAVIKLGCHRYAVQELDLTKYAAGIFLYGPGSNCASLVYSGSGGPGSFLLKLGIVSTGGLQGISLYGINTSRNGGLAANLLIIDGFVDEMGIFRDLTFANTSGNAIVCCGTKGYVNFHIDHVRFDGINGYAVQLIGTKSMEARPFSLTNWTWDNAPNSPVYRKALEAPSFSAANGYGTGILMLSNCNGMAITLRDARIETNVPLRTDASGGHSLIFEENTPIGAGCNISLEDVAGFGNLQARTSLLSSSNPKTNIAISNSMLRYMDSPSLRDPINIGVPNSVASACKVGDIRWNPKPAVDQPVGWVCVQGRDGAAYHSFGRVEF
jgi:hypothetical protein